MINNLKSKNTKIQDINIKRLYFIFISIISVLLIIIQIVIQLAIKNDDFESIVINYAGRQRMLSQNISKTVLKIKLSNNNNLQNEIQNLKLLIDNFEQVHYYLLNGNKELGIIAHTNEKLEKLYASMQPHFDTLVYSARLFIVNFNKIENNQYINRIIRSEQDFLSLMDEIVFEYSAISNRHKHALKLITLAMTILIFCIIILMIIIIIRPVLSKLKLNNYELNRANKELEKTKEVAEKQNELLTEVNATKDKFFSIIAHDLKSPISSIIGFSELLCINFDKYDAEKIKKTIKIINNDTKNIHTLLENLLTWSRSQQGLIQYTPNELKLNGLVTEITMALKNMANQKRISLEINIPESLVVYADKNMLSAIIRNLLSNAIKFTSHGGWVRTYTEYGKQQNKTIKIIVEDNGVGIYAESLKKLFKIEQNHSTVGTAHEKGSGLGLILCREFVEKNKGTIRAESKVNNGSKFIFTLPSEK